eukprot:232398-Pelagomonas_calceolata.AAC.1
MQGWGAHLRAFKGVKRRACERADASVQRPSFLPSLSTKMLHISIYVSKLDDAQTWERCQAWPRTPTPPPDGAYGNA